MLDSPDGISHHRIHVATNRCPEPDLILGHLTPGCCVQQRRPMCPRPCVSSRRTLVAFGYRRPPRPARPVVADHADGIVSGHSIRTRQPPPIQPAASTMSIPVLERRIHFGFAPCRIRGPPTPAALQLGARTRGLLERLASRQQRRSSPPRPGVGLRPRPGLLLPVHSTARRFAKRPRASPSRDTGADIRSFLGGPSVLVYRSFLRATAANAAVAALAASTQSSRQRLPRLLCPPPSGLAVANKNSSTPILSWAKVKKATGYQVQVDDDANFASPEFSVATANFRAVPTAPLRPGAEPLASAGHRRLCHLSLDRRQPRREPRGGACADLPGERGCPSPSLTIHLCCAGRAPKARLHTRCSSTVTPTSSARSPTPRRPRRWSCPIPSSSARTTGASSLRRPPASCRNPRLHRASPCKLWRRPRRRSPEQCRLRRRGRRPRLGSGHRRQELRRPGGDRRGLHQHHRPDQRDRHPGHALFRASDLAQQPVLVAGACHRPARSGHPVDNLAERLPTALAGARRRCCTRLARPGLPRLCRPTTRT